MHELNPMSQGIHSYHVICLINSPNALHEVIQIIVDDHKIDVYAKLTLIITKLKYIKLCTFKRGLGSIKISVVIVLINI